jgi:hypothetical protein
MKHLLILISLFLINNLVISQNLTLAQLLEIKKKDLGNADEYLTTKGWEFKGAEEPSDEKLGSVTYTYNKSEMSEMAESFLKYLYSDYNDKVRITIQINNKTKYNEYINSIKNFGCKLIKSKVEGGRIVKIYRGATTTFEIRSVSSTNFYNQETASWYILIVSNYDYDINWGE